MINIKIEEKKCQATKGRACGKATDSVELFLALERLITRVINPGECSKALKLKLANVKSELLSLLTNPAALRRKSR